MNSKGLKNKINDITNKYDLDEIRKKNENIKNEKIDIKIAFLGEFSSGKSTLINALIGKNILPAFENPTTAVITEISKSNEDKYSVIELNENGDEVERVISISEIANEVTNVELNKRLIIKSKDITFLDDDFTIIDTPGVSSIEECHEDVTYGYLPMVDVAFILMNANLGTAPKSLIDFLKKYPKEMLSKIYFIVNYADQVPPSRIIRLKQSFNNDLKEVVENPNVKIISAKKALDSKLKGDLEKFKESGVDQIESIILQEIVPLKLEIEEKRVCEELTKELGVIKKLLEYKIKTLTWNTEEADIKVKELNKEALLLKKELVDFKNEFNDIKLGAIDKTKKVTMEYINVIAHKASKNDDISEDIKAMTDSISETIGRSVRSVKSIKLESINIDISQIIESETKKEISKVKDIADLVADMATFIVTAIIIPGAKPIQEVLVGGSTIAVGKAGDVVGKAANVADKVSKNGKFIKFLGVIGKVIKEVNPVEKIKNVVLPYVINPKLKTVLLCKVINSVEIIFLELEGSLNEIIKENYLEPINQKEALIKKERDNRNKKLESIDKLKEDLEIDIRGINKILD